MIFEIGGEEEEGEAGEEADGFFFEVACHPVDAEDALSGGEFDEAWVHPEGDGEGEDGGGVALAGGEGAEGGAAGEEVGVHGGAVGEDDAFGTEPPEEEGGEDEDEGDPDFHPVEEGDGVAGEFFEEAHGDDVRGCADGRAETADGGGEGDEEDEVALETAVVAEAWAGVEDPGGDGEHHGGGGDIAHPHGEDGGHGAEGGEESEGRAGDAASGEKPEGHALVEAVAAHGFCEEEAADEEEDGGGGEGGEDGLVVGDAEGDAEGWGEEGGGGHGDGLCDPEDDG